MFLYIISYQMERGVVSLFENLFFFWIVLFLKKLCSTQKHQSDAIAVLEYNDTTKRTSLCKSLKRYLMIYIKDLRIFVSCDQNF